MKRCLSLLLCGMFVMGSLFGAESLKHGYRLGKYNPAKQYANYDRFNQAYRDSGKGTAAGYALGDKYYQARRDAMQALVDGGTNAVSVYKIVEGNFGYFQTEVLEPNSGIIIGMDVHLSTVQEFIDACMNGGWVKSGKYRAAVCRMLEIYASGFDRTDILRLFDESKLTMKEGTMKVLLERYDAIGMNQAEFFTRVNAWKLPQHMILLDCIETHFDDGVVSHIELLREIVNRINTAGWMNAKVKMNVLAKLTAVKSGILVGDLEVGGIIESWQNAAPVGGFIEHVVSLDGFEEYNDAQGHVVTKLGISQEAFDNVILSMKERGRR